MVILIDFIDVVGTLNYFITYHYFRYVTKGNVTYLPPTHLCYVMNHGATPYSPRSNFSLTRNIKLHMRKVFTQILTYRGDHYKAKRY